MEENSDIKEAKKAAKLQDKEAKKAAKLKDKEVKKEEKLRKKEEKNKNKEIVNSIATKPEAEKTSDEKAIVKKLKKENSDKIVILVIVLITLVIAGGLVGWYFYSSNLKPIATYDGGKITKAEYKLYYDRYINTLIQYYGYPLADVPNALAEKAVLDKILLAQANAAGVEASASDVAQIEAQFKDEENIKAFNEQKIDIDKMREMYLNDLKIYAYIQKLAKEAKDEDVLAYLKEQLEEGANLNEYNTSHILFKTTDAEGKAYDDTKKAEVKAKAQEVLKRALAGEDFAALVNEFSEDTGTKANNGEYILYDNGQTVEAYLEAVKAMQAGQVNPTLIESDYGYHIIKLNSIVPEGRKNSQLEREYYVQDNLNAQTETKNVKINLAEAIKVVENLSGQTIETTTNNTVTNNVAE